MNSNTTHLIKVDRITDKHREIADQAIKRLTNSSSMDGRDFRKLGKEGYEVMNWFVQSGVLMQNRQGGALFKGLKFATYTSLDDLLNPPKEEKATVKLEVTGDRTNLHIGDNFGDYNQSRQESNESQNQESNNPRPTPLKNTIIKWILSIVGGVIIALIVWKITGQV
jgi:hypothetical protein